MATELHTARDVIEALGGPKPTAFVTKKTLQAVCNWRLTNKLPASTYLVLSEELKKHGFTAPLSLWGMQAPEGVGQ